MFGIEPVRMNGSVRFVQPVKKLSENNKPIAFQGDKTYLNDSVQNVNLNTNFVIASSKTRLGANYNPETKNIDFKLASKNATDVFLCIFDESENNEAKLTIPLQRKENTNIWETSIPYIELGNDTFYYGYRLFGQNWKYTDDFFDENGNIKNPKSGFKVIVDEKGNRFNPNKIAHDPYSRELSHLPATEEIDDTRFFSVNVFEDSAKYAPKSVFSIVPNEIIPKAKPRTLLDEIIGEVHMKDLTINENVKGAGGYLGAGNFAKKIKETGITMVEFLPLCEFDNNSCGNNHWGYMTLGFFAPAKRYAFDKSAGGALKEFREMIKAFHEQNIKVCMDVVYNHTGEAGLKEDNVEDSRQFSFSLIDNQMYYKQNAGVYNSNSGCGNDMNVAQDETMEFIADSVAFWANQGVDAFRFDLAVGLMDVDESDNVQYDSKNSLIGKLTPMLEARGVKVSNPDESGGIYLIAEPWTCGGQNSYQIGNFPLNWAQWNDVAREAIKNDSINPSSVSPRVLRNILEGSHNVLGDGDRSINYAFSHDGYSLYDANTIEQSSNGWHSTTNYNGDKNSQLKAMKKQIALMLLSKGVPMLQIGDLIAHSKKGNSNSYNQDNDINYLNFAKTKNKDSFEGKIFDFSKDMIEFRKNHPILKNSNFNEFITYYYPNGSVAHDWNDEYWENPDVNILSYKIDYPNSLFVSISSDDKDVEVKLPQPEEGKTWCLVCDTSKENSFEKEKIDSEYILQKPHSIIIYEEEACK